MIKTISIFFLFTFQLFSQEFDPIEYNYPNSIQLKYIKKCFDELKPIEDLKEYSFNKKQSFCNLYECFSLFQHGKQELEEIGIERIKEFSKLFFEEKIYVVLVIGEGSFSDAEEKNLSINDDNERIYVSVGSCRVTKATINAIEIFNAEMSKLFEK